MPGAQVEFCVESSRGPSTRVCQSRVVTVTPGCPLAERLCESGVECSEGGACPEDLTSIALGPEAEEPQSPPAEPPLLELLGAPSVSLRRGVPYRKCAAGDDGSQQAEGAPCEPGAVSACESAAHTHRGCTASARPSVQV